MAIQHPGFDNRPLEPENFPPGPQRPHFRKGDPVLWGIHKATIARSYQDFQTHIVINLPSRAGDKEVDMCLVSVYELTFIPPGDEEAVEATYE